MKSLILGLLLASTVAPAQAPVPTPVPTPAAAPSPALATRAAELLPILNGGGTLAQTFAPEFLTAIPEAQFRALTAQLSGSFGKAVAIQSIQPVGAPGQAIVVVRYERGEVRIGMAVAAAAPGLVSGLRVLSVGAPEATLGAVLDALKALPGRVGFALADLGPDRPTQVQSIDADRPLALGSAFKLVILAELVREVEAGERRWDDLVTLDGTERPAGGYNLKPKGTQVTIRELARQMISVSDNSATDILLDMVGREKVEAMQATVGIAAPARNVPFLGTMEMFKLKGVGGGALGTRYLGADTAGRRALLAGEVAHTPGSAIGALFADGKPVRIAEIEWYASPADLVRVMDWLRRHSEAGPGAEARTILSINPGIGRDIAARYSYAGFKGGSEPGVLNLTLLLRTRAGRWRVLTVGWNDPAAAVDSNRLVALVSRAAELAAQ